MLRSKIQNNYNITSNESINESQLLVKRRSSIPNIKVEHCDDDQTATLELVEIEKILSSFSTQNKILAFMYISNFHVFILNHFRSYLNVLEITAFVTRLNQAL